MPAASSAAFSIPPDISALPADALLTRSQIAALTGFTIDALKKWSREGRGPAVTVLEGRPRYRVADARAWLGKSSPKAAA